MFTMNREYLEFETTPTNEDCAQVGDPNYLEKANEEVAKMRPLLVSKFFHEGNKEFTSLMGTFGKKSCSHDFGSYLELRYAFYEDEEVEVDGVKYCAWDFANFVESNWPETWNDDSPVSFKEYMQNRNN